MNQLLKVIYKRIFGDSFTYSNFDARIKLQKAVYLLENMGVTIGEYSFHWDTYGPYSLNLDYEASQLGEMEPENYVFSKYAENSFDRLKSIAEQQTKYDVTTWMECVASLHYLRNVLRFEDEKAILELRSRKAHMDKEESNRAALYIANTIKVGA